MKKYFTKSIVVLLVVVLTLTLTSVAVAERKKGFDGAWEAIDVDGSYMVMNIHNGGSDFMWFDYGASICNPSVPPETPWVFEGSPVKVGNELTVEGSGLCIVEVPYYNPVDMTVHLTYIRQRDLVELEIGDYLVTFSRIGKK
jgi:hypothetical protein